MEHTHNLSFGPAVTDRGIFKNSELRTPRKLCSATGFRASSEMHKEIPPKYSKVGTLPLSHSITGENFKGKDDKMLLNFQWKSIEVRHSYLATSCEIFISSVFLNSLQHTVHPWSDLCHKHKTVFEANNLQVTKNRSPSLLHLEIRLQRGHYTFFHATEKLLPVCCGLQHNVTMFWS